MKNILLIFYIISFSLTTLSNNLLANEWNLIQEDLWKLETRNMIFYKTSLKQFDINIKTLKEISEAVPSKVELQINANFFDENFKPLGLIINNRQIINKMHNAGNVLTGILIQQKNNLKIIHRDELKQYKPESLDFALQAGPRLISNFNKLTLKNSLVAERRSGLCLSPKNELIIYITNKTSILNFDQLQNTLLREPIKAKDCLNLDGGSSAQYSFYQNSELKDTVIGFSSVPAYLVLSEKNSND